MQKIFASYVFLPLFFLYAESTVFNMNIDKIDVTYEHKTPSFDPTRDLDYCGISCKGEQHVACKCHQDENPQCELRLRPSVVNEFRSATVKWHNRFRQHLASGDEKVKTAGEAADMNAVSYDLGLEYIAMCTASKCVETFDKCRHTKRFAQTGQNIYMYTTTSDTLDDMTHFTHLAIEYWYEALYKIESPDIVDKFASGPWNNFTTMAWSTLTHIGCSPSMKRSRIGKGYELTCNYGIEGGAHVINEIGSPVYKRGKAASGCRDGRKPNKMIPELCGEIEPVPTAKPADFQSGYHGHHSNYCICLKPFNLFIFIISTLRFF